MYHTKHIPLVIFDIYTKTEKNNIILNQFNS